VSAMTAPTALFSRSAAASHARDLPAVAVRRGAALSYAMARTVRAWHARERRLPRGL